MQLRDRAQGAGTDVHGAEGDKARENLRYLISVPCPVCRAKVGELCHQSMGHRKRLYWDAAVHWRRERNVVRKVTSRLRGSI